MKHLFLFSGEPSGDFHGAALMRALKAIYPDIHLTGVGGPQMQLEGLQSVMDMDAFSVMMFSDVIRSFPKLYRNFHALRRHLLKTNPQGVVFVDYPGFNLRMAKVLRKEGYQGKLIQYICPSVWAWGKSRIKQMAKTLDLLLTIFPFEKRYFLQTPLHVEYVGNPTKEYILKHHYDEEWRQRLSIPIDRPLIAIFPGSRQGEIKRNMPKQLEAIRLLRQSDPSLIFGISCISDPFVPLIENIAHSFQLVTGKDLFYIPKKYNYELMRDSHTAIAKSGTVTLELAFHQRPTVVVYELSRLNRLLAKHLLRLNLPYYCIPNILCQKFVFPELIERGFTPQNLYEQIKLLYAEGSRRETCLRDCQELLHLLQEENASERAAKAIGNLIQCPGSL